MAFNYSISIKGNKVAVSLCQCGRMVKRAYAYIRGEGGPKNIAQAVSYAARRLYIDTDWDDIPDDNTILAIDEDELLKEIKTHDEEMKKMRPRELEHYIEIPLSEYRKLVEELAETKVYLMQRHDDIVSQHMELQKANDKITNLSDLYEQVVVELESYRKRCERESAPVLNTTAMEDK